MRGGGGPFRQIKTRRVKRAAAHSPLFRPFTPTNTCTPTHTLFADLPVVAAEEEDDDAPPPLAEAAEGAANMEAVD